MRIIALGGCGGMGRYAVRTALTYDFVDEVVVADLDGERAAEFAQACGSRATAVGLDVEDADALASLLSGADIVLNTVGPFYRFGVTILRAAIDAGCHYLDINDDWEPTLEMLELDEEARQAGIIAVVGVGASPGVSNLLAAKAMSQLDSVEDLITGWGLGGTGADSSEGESGDEARSEPRRPSAALVHWMQQCSGQIRLLRHGEFVDVAPLQKVAVDYPGIGTGTAWTVGHPEPVTLPRFRPELRHSCNVMVGSRRIIDAVRAVAKEIDAGRLTVLQGAELLTGPPPPQPSSESGPQASAAAGQEARLPPLFATARGTRDGKPAAVGVTVLAMPSGGMGGATGVPLGVALSLLASGQIDRRGVCAPEGAIDPDAFFDALAPLCNPPRASGQEMLLVTTSD